MRSRRVWPLIVVLLAMSVSETAPMWAQSAVSDPQDSNENSANDPPGGPAKGANSFAEGQARALIVSKGYGNVSALVNDKDGVWRGTATKDQSKVNVSVDYKGNVVAQ